MQQKIRSALLLPETSAEEVSVPSYSDIVSGFSSNQLMTDSMLESLSPPENSAKIISSSKCGVNFFLTQIFKYFPT